MKTFLSFWLFLFFAFAVSAFAQVDDPCNWGIIFSVKKDFTLGKYYVSSLPQQTTNTTTKPMTSTGFAFEKFFDHSSLTIGADISLDDNKLDYTGGGNREETITEFGLKLSYNNYFRGRETPSKIDPFWSLWGSFTHYSNTITDSQSEVGNTKDEFSGSAVGFGLSFGFWWNIIESNKVSLGALYNLGGMYYPQSSYTSTNSSGTTLGNGPSSLHFGDCGAQLMFRASF
jgi:hypothetical protein